MANTSIYRDIAERTGGDIYIGVVGPVRTGKSTFIKRFMDMFVLPAIEDENERARVRDELPQSAAGKTIMTTQPGFIPNKAADITVGDNVRMSVRLVDCVGYLIDGVQGHVEDGHPRMVNTPWSKEPMPFIEAADMGTKKVIEEHSTIGIVMTTDGSIADIPRQAYVPAEERVIAELKELDKPFIVLLNCMDPASEEAFALADELRKKYDASVIPINATGFTGQDIDDIMSDLLYEFPIKQINLDISRWICALEPEHYIIEQLYEKLDEATRELHSMKDYPAIAESLSDIDFIKNCAVSDISLGEGLINISMRPCETLFYKVLGEQTGCDIKDDRHLISIIKDMAEAKAHYTRLENAINTVKRTGYGIVAPLMDEVECRPPEVMSQGDRYGVRINASAPTLHMIRVDVETEVSPIIGSEEQSEEFARTLVADFENDPQTAWATEIFGRTLGDMVKEGLMSKVTYLHEDAQSKLRDTIERAVNEGGSGMLFILL